MRLTLISLVVVTAVSFSPPPAVRVRMCELFGAAAYACVEAQLSVSPIPDSPVPGKCCGKCNGTGKVLSGDGLALVDCECPEGCPCKSKADSCEKGECKK